MVETVTFLHEVERGNLSFQHPDVSLDVLQATLNTKRGYEKLLLGSGNSQITLQTHNHHRDGMWSPGSDSLSVSWTKEGFGRINTIFDPDRSFQNYLTGTPFPSDYPLIYAFFKRLSENQSELKKVIGWLTTPESLPVQAFDKCAALIQRRKRHRIYLPDAYLDVPADHRPADIGHCNRLYFTENIDGTGGRMIDRNKISVGDFDLLQRFVEHWWH